MARTHCLGSSLCFAPTNWHAPAVSAGCCCVSRLLRPQHVSMQLPSYASNALGRHSVLPTWLILESEPEHKSLVIRACGFELGGYDTRNIFYPGILIAFKDTVAWCLRVVQNRRKHSGAAAMPLQHRAGPEMCPFHNIAVPVNRLLGVHTTIIWDAFCLRVLKHVGPPCSGSTDARDFVGGPSVTPDLFDNLERTTDGCCATLTHIPWPSAASTISKYLQITRKISLGTCSTTTVVCKFHPRYRAHWST